MAKGMTNFDYLLIERYINHYCITLSTDYGEKKSVKKHNKEMIACRKIASDIQSIYPELKEPFYLLLDSDVPNLRVLVAHHMIEVMEYDDIHKAKALNIILDRSKEGSVEGLGNRMWLKDYLEKYPDDKKMLNFSDDSSEAWE